MATCNKVWYMMCYIWSYFVEIFQLRSVSKQMWWLEMMNMNVTIWKYELCSTDLHSEFGLILDCSNLWRDFCTLMHLPNKKNLEAQKTIPHMKARRQWYFWLNSKKASLTSSGWSSLCIKSKDTIIKHYFRWRTSSWVGIDL